MIIPLWNVNLTWPPHLEIARGTFNASCSYAGPPPESNVVAFYEEMEAIRDAEERYEPGAELVFRCVDIGKQDYLLNSTNVSYSKNCLNGSKSFLYLLWFKLLR